MKYGGKIRKKFGLYIWRWENLVIKAIYFTFIVHAWMMRRKRISNSEQLEASCFHVDQTWWENSERHCSKLKHGSKLNWLPVSFPRQMPVNWGTCQKVSSSFSFKPSLSELKINVCLMSLAEHCTFLKSSYVVFPTLGEIELTDRVALTNEL